jgi:hypothetical protein
MKWLLLGGTLLCNVAYATCNVPFNVRAGMTEHSLVELCGMPEDSWTDGGEGKIYMYVDDIFPHKSYYIYASAGRVINYRTYSL